jgi:hypothetical protein
MKKLLTAFTVFVISIAAFSGCVTTRSIGGGEGVQQDSISVKLLSEKEVKDAYGWSLQNNPYLALGGMLLPKAYDFLVFKIEVNMVSETQIELIGAGAKNEKGVVKAPYYSMEEFKEVTMRSVEDQANSGSYSTRENKVTWYYMPSGTVTLEPGKHSYTFVLVGKHPLPDSLTAHIQFSVDGQEKDFDLPIPDAK